MVSIVSLLRKHPERVRVGNQQNDDRHNEREQNDDGRLSQEAPQTQFFS
jgi:hypothetical protein